MVAIATMVKRKGFLSLLVPVQNVISQEQVHLTVEGFHSCSAVWIEEVGSAIKSL